MGIDAQMFAKVKRPITNDEIEAVRYRMVEAFGHALFWQKTDPKNQRRALVQIDEYIQDGPFLYPGPGETFIEVSLATRYYGIDYERGNLPFIIALADYLEIAIPGSEIYYGGDPSGVCAYLFDRAARDELFKHFVKYGHRPYVDSFSSISISRGLKSPICVFCNQKMYLHLYGGSREVEFACHGCDIKLRTMNGGKSCKTVKPY